MRGTYYVAVHVLDSRLHEHQQLSEAQRGRRQQPAEDAAAGLGEGVTV